MSNFQDFIKFEKYVKDWARENECAYIFNEITESWFKDPFPGDNYQESATGLQDRVREAILALVSIDKGKVEAETKVNELTENLSEMETENKSLSVENKSLSDKMLEVEAENVRLREILSLKK